MVHLVCLFMKIYLLVLLQDNCLDLLCCAFLRKLSGCMRNITAFCQYLLRPIKLADSNIGKTQLLVAISTNWPIFCDNSDWLVFLSDFCTGYSHALCYNTLHFFLWSFAAKLNQSFVFKHPLNTFSLSLCILMYLEMKQQILGYEPIRI